MKIESDIYEASHIYLKPIAPVKFPLNDFLGIYAREVLSDIKYIMPNNFVEFVYYGRLRRFRVVKITSSTTIINQDNENPHYIYYINNKTTNIHWIPYVDKKENQDKKNDVNENIGYQAVGGLSKQIEIIKNMVELPLKNPEKFTNLGLKLPKGILLYGPPGTGKTLIARAVGAETKSNVICINGPEIISKYYGETETKLRNIFNEALEKAPSIIFIDEIDALCPKRDESENEVEKRIVATLLTLMDGIDNKEMSSNNENSNKNHVVLIGTTNRPNSIDEALRRPGRFDREVEIGIPNANERKEILEVLLRNVPHTLTDENITKISSITHGYVGADLASLCREAGLKTIKRALRNHDNLLNRDESDNMDIDIKVSFEDMNAAFKEVRPSAMREIMLEVPKVSWEDIGGQDEIKQKLKESVEWPLQHPESFIRLGIRPPKGILLYGPPGCSKTLMAKALATEAGLNFIAVKGPELFSKWVGESEKAVREVFKKARAASPSIVFFDEIDSLAVRRGGDETSVADRVLSQLLSELDGIEPLVNVTVVAATNRPDIIDSALLRPGRIDRILYVSPPDEASRIKIMQIQTKKMPLSPDVDFNALNQKMEGFSGAECVALCQNAAIHAMEEDIHTDMIYQRHFEKALKNITPRITKEMIEFYDNFRKRSGLRSV
ncbi:AAA-domain-containing protein [Anaeromyces robustus]|uniref:AAA-domain-containing protein n=1 Tax=Anaeromyces robustus TaxID=1754192 RepID=A0A1Y1WY15_9FUNG|nr:AAA-domain-containing protein [Anaeromyces robustus]|eukprot:ORX78441.1 AAA-domain-containing protein [Anaeromyces robustus]